MTNTSPHIIVAVTNDLVTDQRVDRTCRALSADGWRVTLVGRRLPHSPELAPRGYAVHRMRLLFRRSAAFYAEYNIRLFLLLFFSRADAVFSNDTDTLAACCLAARLRRRALYYDAHELFPDVPELQGRPRVQNVWKWIERKALPHVTQAFTVSQSVADEYRRRYGIDMTVVRNVPERMENGELSDCLNVLMRECLSENTQTIKQSSNQAFSILNSQLLYQGAVNIGRGIREMIDVLPLLPDCRLVVAGDGDLLEQMKAYAAAQPWHDRVEFLGRVQPDRLRALTAQATLGLCLLEDLGLNYRYSLPNRIADFAQAGVPVLATDFPEIRRVIEEYGTGTLVEPLPAEKEGEAYRQYLARLAEAVRAALRHWRDMPEQEYRRRFARAADELNWQHEQKNLLASMHRPR
jgi:glycosyltransferase involved in cell wall biosynthesis